MISVAACYFLIYLCGIIGVAYAWLNYSRVKSISVKEQLEFELTNAPMGRNSDREDTAALDREKIFAMLEIGDLISRVNPFALR